MKGFWYYFPGSMGASVETGKVLDRVKGVHAALWGWMRESGFEVGVVERGPDGGEGFLVALHPADGSPAEGCLLKPDVQTWVPRSGGKWWLGWDSAAGLPVPEDLERPASAQLFAGHCLLGRGSSWKMPAARVLPWYLGLDVVSGTRAWKLRPEHEPLSRLGEEVADSLVDASAQFPEFGLSDDRKAAIFEVCLGLNYRVGAWELDALCLGSETDLTVALAALMDWGLSEDELGNSKKKRG